MKGQPSRKGLFVPSNRGMVLMRMGDGALEIWKDETAHRFWMNEEMRTDKLLHHPLQRGMMGQRMKRGQTEDLIVDGFKSSVILEAGGVGIGDSIEWIAIRVQPP